MFARRRWIKQSLVAVAALFAGRVTLGQEGNSFNSAGRIRGTNVVSLEDQLTNGLRVTKPGQVQFLKTVVLYVNQGKIPQTMVNLIYRWALERNPSVPYPYFEYAMRVLSKRRGVSFPA